MKITDPLALTYAINMQGQREMNAEMDLRDLYILKTRPGGHEVIMWTITDFQKGKNGEVLASVYTYKTDVKTIKFDNFKQQVCALVGGGLSGGQFMCTVEALV